MEEDAMVESFLDDGLVKVRPVMTSTALKKRQSIRGSHEPRTCKLRRLEGVTTRRYSDVADSVERHASLNAQVEVAYDYKQSSALLCTLYRAGIAE